MPGHVLSGSLSVLGFYLNNDALTLSRTGGNSLSCEPGKLPVRFLSEPVAPDREFSEQAPKRSRHNVQRHVVLTRMSSAGMAPGDIFLPAWRANHHHFYSIPVIFYSGIVPDSRLQTRPPGDMHVTLR